MKANAPDKIYCAPTEDGFYLTTIKPEPPFTDGVEYIRADAFIEKAEEYIYKQLNEGRIECGDIEKFIKDFKNYMEGE